MPEMPDPTRRRLLRGLLLLPAAALWGPPLLAGEPRPARVPVTLHGEAGPLRVRAEVARSRAERGRGLMEREHLPPDAGMLFLYDRPQSSRNGFWMYRTRIPLDIAFIGENGRILEIHRMAPCSADAARECPVTRPGSTYRAALEVNAGYFEAKGVRPGDCVSWPGDGGECRPAGVAAGD